ncbi:hypothetical protein ABB02_00186 [Clostridiaceae bacterium JG1575]|nr:hypothetical protein ABB02_00186 [Clostridiaceae bacterium JG1575]
MKICAIILAAGSSRRMGEDKLELPLEGESMLQRVLSPIAALGFAQILVVHRPGKNKQALPEEVQWVENPNHALGQGTSIVQGVAAAIPDADGYAFFMADQPDVSLDTLKQLRAAFEAHPQSIIQPLYADEPAGPVFFPKDLRDDFLALRGTDTGRRVLLDHKELLRPVPIEREWEGRDLDTPSEYLARTKDPLILVKGAGDLATGILYVLYQAGYRVVATDLPRPSCIRTTVSFASALTNGTHCVEGVCAKRAESPEAALRFVDEGLIPILADPLLAGRKKLAPMIFVDAVIAKTNTGTHPGLAPLVIALGPGFTAPKDCTAVIETMRGPKLGQILYEGAAQPNTGVPGLIAGEAARRVVHAPAEGPLRPVRRIGDVVQEGEIIAFLGDTPVRAPLTGLLRGLIQEGYPVTRGLKIADVDPSTESTLAFTISDKARKLGESVLFVVKEWQRAAKSAKK